MTGPTVRAGRAMRERPGRTRHWQPTRRTAALPALAAAVLALAIACSGGPHPARSQTRSAASLAAMHSYARCLRAHGLPKVYVTRAPGAARGPSDPSRIAVLIFNGLAIEGASPGSRQVRTAGHACHRLLPHGTR